MKRLHLLSTFLLSCTKFILSAYVESGIIEDQLNTYFIESLAGSPVMSNMLVMEFNISFPLTKCCPILYLNYGAMQEDKFEYRILKCFDERDLANNLAVDRTLWWLKPGKETSTCYVDNDHVLCSGRVELSAGIDITWNITVGYPCDDQQVLEFEYEVLFDWMRTITCKEFEPDLYPSHALCSPFYTSYSPLNPVAFTQSDIDRFVGTATAPYLESGCYQHLIIYGCYSFFPPCTNGTFKPACKQMCHEFIGGCGVSREVGWYIGCSGMPPSTDPDVCFYEPVNCVKPHTDHGSVTMAKEGTKSAVQFQCDHGYKLSGSEKATCELSGKWSESGQKCRSVIHIIAVASACTLLALVFITLIAIFLYVRRRRRKQAESVIENILHANEICYIEESYQVTQKHYDIFLAHSDEDYYHVKSTFAQPLEEKFNLKLCIADRDFTPGHTITNNIVQCLYKSKGAVMIVTSKFLHSVWCKFELYQAYTKVLTERDFRLILVFAEDTGINQMTNTSKLFKSFFKQFTCLRATEKDILRKISELISKN